MPAPLTTIDDTQELPTVQPYLVWWVRALLLGLIAGLVTVFSVAAYLHPYGDDGSPLTMETHRQLNLPPCTFKELTHGVPCPSCGMTTSFSLLMHGDLVNSMRANWVGTLLALYGLVLIPWGLVSVWRRQPLFVQSLEQVLSWSVVTFLVLMLLRWSIVLALMWWRGQVF